MRTVPELIEMLPSIQVMPIPKETGLAVQFFVDVPLSVIPPLALRRPVPAIVLPIQVVGPVIVRLPVPVSVPPERYKAPNVAFALNVAVPLLTVNNPFKAHDPETVVEPEAA